MWNWAASEAGERVSWARPIQNNFTRASLHVSTSGTPHILQMNFSVDITKFSVKGPLPRPTGQSDQRDVAQTPAYSRLSFHGNWTETNYHNRLRHGRQVLCPLDMRISWTGKYFGGTVSQFSCRDVYTSFCHSVLEVEACLCHAQTQLWFLFKYGCSAKLTGYQRLRGQSSKIN